MVSFSVENHLTPYRKLPSLGKLLHISESQLNYHLPGETILKADLVKPSVGFPWISYGAYCSTVVHAAFKLSHRYSSCCGESCFVLFRNYVSPLIHSYDFKIRTEENNQHTKYFL